MQITNLTNLTNPTDPDAAVPRRVRARTRTAAGGVLAPPAPETTAASQADRANPEAVAASAPGRARGAATRAPSGRPAASARACPG